MKRRSSTCAAIISFLVVGWLSAEAVSAELWQHRVATWDVWTTTTQAHPKKYKLAYMATETYKPNEADLNYVLDRVGWDSCCEPGLESVGKIVATLQLITEDGIQKLGKKKGKVWLRTVEGNLFQQRRCTLSWRLRTELKPGDVLLWTVKFIKMPKLENEEDELFYFDRFTLEGKVAANDP